MIAFGKMEAVLRGAIEEAVLGYDVALMTPQSRDIAPLLRRLQKMAGEGTPQWDKGKIVFEGGGSIKIMRGGR